MENKNRDQGVSWLDRDIYRFKETGHLIPPVQIKLYRSLAAHWAPGRTILDIGCSIGTGTNYLSHYARHVWGIDINEEAIRFAKEIFERPNLSFEVMDVENPPTRELAPFEVVLMIEVIEHLTDPVIGINFMKKFFSDKLNTVGFITAPNRNNPRVCKLDDKNDLHLHRWTAGEFYSFLTEHFNAVTLYNGDAVDRWTAEETMDGNGMGSIVIAKVEYPK